MIVLDASVLIAHLDNRDAHHQRALQLIATSGSQTLGANSITLAETMVAPARAGRVDDAQAAVDKLGIVELANGEHSARRLAQIRAESGLKMPDCCVILTAQEHDGAIASFDERLSKTAAQLGLPVVAGPFS